MKRLRIRVSGVVQGVGFRPFLHRRAEALNLSGWCRNTGFGVELEVEGAHPELLLEDKLPPLAVVEEVAAEEIAAVGDKGFAILPSRPGVHDTLVAPDIATCPDCLRELRSAGDRRYGYPFINCTNCGPRFTIVERTPYDRESTSMAGFAMCPACGAEFGDIRDRRYHAQPDCCADCGPRLTYVDELGEREGDPFRYARRRLTIGGIVAVKGLGGFHLACALDRDTVERLRARKGRWAKPLAIMCRDAVAAARYCRISEAERNWLEHPRRPIVLLEKRDSNDYDYLSATHTLGVLLPYTPVHHLLFDGAPYDALVMTSANLSDLPAIISNEEALQKLSGVADGFLLHDRDILRRCDDSLLSVVEGEAVFYRRSRGFAPQPLRLHFDASGILALGAEQKASFALGKGNRAFYSQHIGDLKNAETLSHYESQIEGFGALFDIQPRRFVCDLHPDFLSTRYGRERGDLLQVQHHHGHMCSCMADNGLEGACIALTWDGTGLGSDGTIWGGETLVGGYEAFTRLGSLRPIRLPGGDGAIRQIGRIARSLCYDAGIPYDGEPMVEAMLRADLNCPPSSGMGRLFDGVYSLLTGAKAAGYEGEGAVRLESLAHRSDDAGRYPVALYEEAGVLRLDTRPIITAILEDDSANEVRARRFHNTLMQYAVQTCLHAREKTGLERVVLSGGVFLNSILLTGVTRALEEQRFQVYRHHRVSPGDEGIALGQLAVAAHQRRS